MKFDVKTHESLILLAGPLILIEQEAVRLVSSLLLESPLEPNQIMSGAGVSLVLASAAATGVRNVWTSRRSNGENRPNGDNSG